MLKLKRKFGDRYDGYRVRNVDPFFLLIPHIMKERNDAQVYFSDRVEITELEKFIRRHEAEDIPGLKLFHVIVAAMVRIVSQKPYLNRFAMKGKLFARNKLTISMSIKRGEGDSALTTAVKPEFELTDTLADVVKKFNIAIEENRPAETENSTDNTASSLGKLPSGLLGFVVNILRFLDHRGWLPKIINRVSPFHTSIFITNMGSIGIHPIYHHIYNFGTTSVFIGMGKKTTEREIDAEGNVIKHRYIGFKVVADERICDGQYYASSMRMLARILRNPEVLLSPPEKVVMDDGIVMKGRL